MGDFARYIIGTNSHSFSWEANRIDKKKIITKKEQYNNFLDSLTRRQLNAWNRWSSDRGDLNILKYMREMKNSEIEIEIDVLALSQEIEELVNKIEFDEKSFRKTLGKRKTKTFETCCYPFLDKRLPDESQFDLSVVQRFILQRVIDYGWTKEQFGEFDFHLNRYTYSGRAAKKAERIGKKYQWIAFHECLARISDNFVFKEDNWRTHNSKYDGTYQLNLRDIDPSCLLTQTHLDSLTNNWWFNCKFEKWREIEDDVQWISDDSDLPNPISILQCEKHDRATEWLILESLFRWEEPSKEELERYQNPHRDMWYIIRSYLVNSNEIDEVTNWFKSVKNRHSDIPHSRDIHNVFLSEFYWSNAYNEVFGDDEWTQGYGNVIPKRILVTAHEYLQENSTYDCSIEETINFLTLQNGLPKK